MFKANGIQRDIGVHQIVFAIFFATVVAVGQFHPSRFSDALLTYLLFILVFNSAYFAYGRSRQVSRNALMVYLAANSMAIFFILRETGGRESMFWVAFLLPVLVAAVSDCVPWAALSFASALLAFIYGRDLLEGYEAAEWLLKAGTLGFAAAVTHRTSRHEESLRRKIEEKRLHLEYLAAKMLEEHGPIRTDGVLLDQVENRLRMLENPLAVLEDSTRLAQLEAPSASTDLKRIEACHRLIKAITQDLFDILYHDEFWIEAYSFDEVYRTVLKELRYPLAVKELHFVENIDPTLPLVPMSKSHVEQFLHAVLGRAVLACEHQQTIEVHANMAGLADEPYLEVMLVHPGLSDPSSLSRLKRIAERHGGWVQFEYLTRAVRYTLALPLHRGARLPPPA